MYRLCIGYPVRRSRRRRRKDMTKFRDGQDIAPKRLAYAHATDRGGEMLGGGQWYCPANGQYCVLCRRWYRRLRDNIQGEIRDDT